ncbi:hypothetical protein V8C44DRAFT_368538 [Trichoderma aethiopicum]
MATRSDTLPRNKGRQTPNIGQPKQNPRFAQFPKAPLKASSRKYLQETVCERILLPQEQPPFQNEPETKYHERKPGMVRFVRKPVIKAVPRERRNPAVPVSSSIPTAADDKAKQRRVSRQIRTAQRPRASKKALKPQLSIRTVEPGGQRPSKQWNIVRSMLPATTKVQAVRPAAVRFPISREPSPEEHSAHVCYLCRAPGTHGGEELCGPCRTECAMPFGGPYDEGDEEEVEEGKSGIQLSSRSYSSSIYSASSSVYSGDVTPINDDAMMVSPVSRGLQAIYTNGYDEKDAGTETSDLYELDWAEYYFNDEYFADAKGGWSDSLS